MGNVWEYTNDNFLKNLTTCVLFGLYCHTNPKQYHLVFGHGYTTKSSAHLDFLNILRPIYTTEEFKQNIGFRLIRHPKHAPANITILYELDSWNQLHHEQDTAWKWDIVHQNLVLAGADYLEYMFDHADDYSPRTQNTLSKLRSLDSAENLVTLRFIGLDSCQISDLQPLAELRQLTKLLLRNNQISDLKPLAELTGKF